MKKYFEPEFCQILFSDKGKMAVADVLSASTYVEDTDTLDDIFDDGWGVSL